MKPIYLDYAATTPVDPAVARTMQAFLTIEGTFGNASSSTHVFGKRAAQEVESARARVAALIGAEPAEIVFTSGATESNNLAVLGIARANADRGRHIVTSRIEHKAVLDPCKRLEKEGFAVTYLAPDRSGSVDPQAVRAAVRPDTVLVSIMHVNNEIGVIQDIDAIGEICRARGIPFHTDAAQSAGKLPLNVGTQPIDFLSFTAHKIYGPKGIGALYVRRASRPWLQPLSFGGGQEGGLRPGTLPVAQIAAFGVACELALRDRESEMERIGALRDRLWEGIRRLEHVHLNGAGAPRIAGVLNISFEGVEGESLITALPALAVSTSAACSSASDEPSYVLRALGRGTQLAESSLRFSLGRFTMPEDIEGALEQVTRAVTRLRAVSPREWPGLKALPYVPRASIGASTGAVDVSDSAPIFSTEQDLLSPPTRRYFDTLPHAGSISDSAGKVLRGEAGAEDREAWVRFHVLVESDTVKDARFQAWGCPHTLAVAAWLTAQLPGRGLNATMVGGPLDWAQVLQVPTEKLGRLLVVEDALRAALQRGS